MRDSVVTSAARASLAAGPAFTLQLMLFAYVQSAPTTFSNSDLGAFIYLPWVLIASCVVGTLGAFPTCLIAGGILWHVAERSVLARPLVVWIATGAGLAILIIQQLAWTGFEAAAYALVGTAMACAALVRNFVDWD